MTDPHTTTTETLAYPRNIVQFHPDNRTPLQRAMREFAWRALDLGTPFAVIEHRRKRYALICIRSEPVGWVSHIVQRPPGGHSDFQTFDVGDGFVLDVLALAIPPGGRLAVRATQHAQCSVLTPTATYSYENDQHPGR